MRRVTTRFLLFGLILVMGCVRFAPLRSPPPATDTPSPAAPSSTASLLPSQTSTPVPSRTPSPTPTLFPMMIEAMRQRAYPGSDITIVEELTATTAYRRYYVYYLSDGLKIYALLTVPIGEKPEGGWPALMFNHGYIAPVDYRTTEKYTQYVDRLARSGYVVFRVDYRGHDHSEGIADGGYGAPGYTVDVLNALASLKRYPDVNPDRIGMWGHSMGGFLTLRAMVISKDVKVGVIWAGVVGSFPDMLYNWPLGPGVPPFSARYWRDDWPEQFGAPEDNPGFWAAISANSYLADLSGPLQIHHGTLDEIVPVEFSEKLADQVRAAGKPVELYTYPGDNHNLSGHFTLAMDRTILFFDQFLK